MYIHCSGGFGLTAAGVWVWMENNRTSCSVYWWCVLDFTEPENRENNNPSATHQSSLPDRGSSLPGPWRSGLHPWCQTEINKKLESALACVYSLRTWLASSHRDGLMVFHRVLICNIRNSKQMMTSNCLMLVSLSLMSSRSSSVMATSSVWVVIWPQSSWLYTKRTAFKKNKCGWNNVCEQTVTTEYWTQLQNVTESSFLLCLLYVVFSHSHSFLLHFNCMKWLLKQQICTRITTFQQQHLCEHRICNTVDFTC